MSGPILQGPKAGRHWPAEETTDEDPETGVRVRRLTGHPDSDNRHLYFTENGWYDDGNRLLVRARRDGSQDLYSVDLRSGLLTQLTDLPGDVTKITRSPHSSTAFFWHERTLVALDLETLAVTPVYEREAEYASSMPGVTADGDVVCFPLVEEPEARPSFSGNSPAADDEPEEAETAVDRGTWMETTYESRPHSRILAVPTDGGEPTVLYEADTWLGHVNTSPERPELLTYCQEGPWDEVDHRIWGLNRETGETWRIRPTAEGEAVGHEYWLADGETVGYHGWRGTRDDPDAFFGQIRHDNTERLEGTAPDLYTHFHSNTRELVVGDGTHRGIPQLLVWTFDEEAGDFRGPWKLATHGWAGDDDVHPHARVSPDGSTVVFDSSRGESDSDVYLVDVPDLETLPRADIDDVPR